MTILYNILGYITDGLGLIKKYPKFFLGVAIAIFVMLFFKQCEDNRQLKNSIEQLEVDIDNESNRTLNNIKALRDSVITINETNTYLKGVVRVKDGENEILSERIGKQVVKINTLKEKLDDKIKIKNTEGILRISLRFPELLAGDKVNVKLFYNKDIQTIDGNEHQHLSFE